MRYLAALLATALPVQANGLAQLLPAGKFAARDGRPGPGKSWTLTDAAGQALAVQLNAIAAKTPISIDYEHQTLLAATNGQPAPAAGWIQSVEWRNGEGLFAQVKWTDRALALITADEYRYISPVILYDQAGNVTGLHNAALVSVPGLVGMDAVQAALAAQFPTTTPSANRQETHMELVQLIALLGLASGATAADVTAAITALMARPALGSVPAALASALGLANNADEAAALAAVGQLRKPDASAVQTIATLQAQLAALTAQVNTRNVNEVVDAAIAAGKLVPAMREWAVNLGQKDMAQLNSYVAAAPVIPGLAGQNGAGRSAADTGTGGEIDAAELSARIVAYQADQQKLGVTVSASQAAKAVMATSK